jgi:hypothetical protein
VSAVVPHRISNALAESVVPAHLHDELATSPWLAAATGEAQIEAALDMLRAAVPSPLAGHLAGVTILIDHHRHVTDALIQTNRDELIVEALTAFAAAWPAFGYAAPRVVWRTVERLTLHASTLPGNLVALLPALCGARYTPTREVAVALAIRAGLRDEIAATIPADGKRRNPLQRALEAIDMARQAPRGVEAILASALAAWRETRDPALLPWIALADRECARSRDPLVDAEQEAWLSVAVANDAADTARLLEAMPDEGDVRRPARIAALARRDLHPRYAGVVELASLLGGVTPGVVNPARLAALARDLEGTARKWNLLDEHARAPGDLGLRAVLADVLVEAGDPQGELITLQSAIAEGVVDPKAETRVRQLVAQCGARFIGPLPAVEKDHCRFERGFLVTVRTRASAEQLRAVAHHPAWSTVEELGCSRGPIPANLPRLRILEVDDVDALAELERRGPHPHVQVIATWRAWMPRDRTTFPALRVLAGRYDAGELAMIGASGIPIAVVYWLWQHHVAPFLTARAAGPPILRLSGGRSIVHGERRGWQIEIARGADIAHARVSSLEERGAQEVLQELARHVRTIYLRTDEIEQLRILVASGTVGAALVRTEHDIEITAPTASFISQRA